MSEKYWLDKMNENPRYREIWEKIKELPFHKTTEIILDLEAKLAESESNVKVGEFWHSAYQGKQLDYDKVYAELRQSYDEIEQLKQQLADITEKYNACQEARKLENEFYQQDKKELRQQLAEKDEEIKQLKFQIAVDEDWAITNRTRLTELEDEISEVESFMKNYGFDSLDELKEYYVNLLELKDWIEDRIDGTESDNGIYTEFNSGQCNAYCKILDKLNELYNPNQNQTAIEELEKVKGCIDKRNNGTRNGHCSEQYKDGYSACCCDVADIIDQQIKSLKGETDGSTN